MSDGCGERSGTFNLSSSSCGGHIASVLITISVTMLMGIDCASYNAIGLFGSIRNAIEIEGSMVI